MLLVATLVHIAMLHDYSVTLLFPFLGPASTPGSLCHLSAARLVTVAILLPFVWHCWPVIMSFYLTVKYLREVTPFFRKASVLADLGWELQTGFLGAEGGFLPLNGEAPSQADTPLSNGPDTRSITLLFCHLTRNHKCKGMLLIFIVFRSGAFRIHK